jgi:hypothetical protein
LINCKNCTYEMHNIYKIIEIINFLVEYAKKLYVFFSIIIMGNNLITQYTSSIYIFDTHLRYTSSIHIFDIPYSHLQT